MGAILLSPGMQSRAQAPKPPAVESRSQAQVGSRSGDVPGDVVILNNASDLKDFLKRLKQPDLILIKPGAQGSSPAPVPPIPESPQPRNSIINAVKMHGRANSDLADLEIDIDLSLLASGETWVPIGIDSAILGSARRGP